MNEGTYLLVLVLGTIASAIVLVRYRDLIAPVSNSNAPGRRSPAGAAAPGRRRSAPASRRPARTPRERVHTHERHQEAQSSRVQGSAGGVQGSHVHTEQEATHDVIMSADELKRLTVAIMIYTQTRNEQTAIESAFECSKGGSKRWKRAKHLFDIASVSLDRVPAEQMIAT